MWTCTQEQVTSDRGARQPLYAAADAERQVASADGVVASCAHHDGPHRILVLQLTDLLDHGLNIPTLNFAPPTSQSRELLDRENVLRVT